jgi:serine/threonine-protein phosphatase PP1 catalytic subunit
MYPELYAGKRKFTLKLWKNFIDTFNSMPISAIIEEKILCMHGGISPELLKIKKLLTLNRPTDIPSQGMLCDVLWSDPVEEGKGWLENKERGISYLFGADVLAQFLKNNDLDLICRSHQVGLSLRR